MVVVNDRQEKKKEKKMKAKWELKLEDLLVKN